MAFNKEIEKVKAQIKVLEKNLSFLEEIEKQPKMTLANSGEFDVVSYNYKLYYRFEYPDSDNFSWYKTQDVPKGYVTGVFEPVTDAETERLLEGLYYNYIQVKKEKEQQTKSPAEEAYKDWWGEYPGDENWTSDATRWQGFQAGYEFAYQEKIMEKVQEEQKWDAVRESVKWCKEHPDKDPLDWVKPQTPEQVADGLKEAFREAVKNGIIPEVDKLSDDFMDKMVAKLKGKTLMDLIYDWWEDIFTKNSDLDMENCIGRLVYWIEEWLPKEQSAAGSQNVYVECTVEGFNDCLNKIKRKLR